MANGESPVVTDIRLNLAARYPENNEDERCSDGSANTGRSPDFDYPMNSFEEDNDGLLNGIMSDSSFDFFPDISYPSSTSPQQQQHVVQRHSPLIVFEHQGTSISLSFINPPECFYHVRYVSEITDSPLNGSVANTEVTTKKNLSGRYLKGVRGRYITIALPKMLYNYSDLYIRVTRLTVPYQDISFIHPYPISYSYKKEKSRSQVITKDSSIYFKVSMDEIRWCSKQFPNIILTRCKQSDLNKMNNLYPFDNSGISYPFSGTNAKGKIALYDLKKSYLDFRLVTRCEQTQEFYDTGVSCRSNALLEAEGVEWKRSSS